MIKKQPIKRKQMPKLIAYTFFYFICLTSFSQHSGSVEYNLFINLSEEIEDVFKKLDGIGAISLDEGAKKVTFVLEFKNYDSKFYLVESIGAKDTDAKMALGWSRFQNTTFGNVKNKTVRHNNKNNSFFDKEEFVIEKQMFDSWELKNEKKEIQGFICYKAIGFDIVTTSKGKEKKEVIAWYCPELPFSFGPNGYGGLPGLILELQTENALYGATKISLNAQIDNIDSSNLKGQKITAEEYSEILLKRTGVIMEGR